MSGRHRSGRPSRFEQLDRAVHVRRADWLLERVGPWLGAAPRVLDVGAGDCLLADLVEHRLGTQVTCLDVSDTRLSEHRLVLYDGERFPFGDGQFDTVLFSTVLHHCRHPLRVLAEARRVASRQILVIEDLYGTRRQRLCVRGLHAYLQVVEGYPCYGLHFRPREAWQTLFRRLGLAVAEVRDLGRHAGLFPTENVLFRLLTPARAVS
jgi:SAM-dependent methyltransferase